MKNNMLKGICAAAVCIALGTFASNNSAQAATTDPTVSSRFYQDTSMRRNKMSGTKNDKMNGRMGGKMSGDSTGKMGNMKGKTSGGYKSKGMGKSKMDTTNNK